MSRCLWWPGWLLYRNREVLLFGENVSVECYPISRLTMCTQKFFTFYNSAPFVKAKFHTLDVTMREWIESYLCMRTKICHRRTLSAEWYVIYIIPDNVIYVIYVPTAPGLGFESTTVTLFEYRETRHQKCNHTPTARSSPAVKKLAGKTLV